MRQYIAEENYEESIKNTVLPYLEQHKEDGYLKVTEDVTLHYQFYKAENPRGTLTVLHGFTESIPKYREFIYMMLKDGLNVFIYEHRGHGWSTRLVDNYQYTYVRRFEYYIRDLEVIIREKISKLPGPHYLYSHSMGGAVCAMYLETGSTFFQKAILSSPMIAPSCGAYPTWFCRFLFGAASALGFRKKRVFIYPKVRGDREWDPADNDSSPVRFASYEKNRRTFRECSNFAPTYSWINESLKVTRKILAKGKPEQISVPVLLFSAEKDNTVLIPPQHKFIARVKNGELRTVANGTHTLFMNTDDITHPYYDLVLDYLK